MKNALRKLTEETNMKTYRKHMVSLLCGLAERADLVCQVDGYNLEYDFTGDLPAYPEKYNKKNWERDCIPIEGIVLNFILPELDRAIADSEPHEHTKLDQLNNIKDILTDIDWSEV